MAHYVICKKCGNKFDRDRYPYIQVGARRYAHVDCDVANTELKDLQDLKDYIIQKFNTEYVDPKILKEIEKYRVDYDFTYSGMHKALIYFFDIKGNNIKKANGHLGILPYIYEDAKRYYYAQWIAQMRNDDKKIEDYVPKVVQVKIPKPQITVKKRELFTFLDEIEVE